MQPALRLCTAQASEGSLGDILEDFDVERLIGQDLLKRAILIFEFPHLREIAHFKAVVLRSPAAERRLAPFLRFTAWLGH